MKNRWGDDVENYPPGLYNVIWAYCKIEALKYIDAHCPQAWFRPVFDPKDPIHAQLNPVDETPAATQPDSEKQSICPVFVRYDMRDSVWAQVVLESNHTVIVEREEAESFIVEYGSQEHCDRELARLEGMVSYEIVTINTETGEVNETTSKG
jgi:hypothetical protein